MPSPEPAEGATRGETLLAVARAAVASAVREGRRLEVDPERYPPELRERRATFVTLRLGGTLRGCTGGLEPVNPLVVDVAKSAHSAALHDSRFSPVEEHELEDLEIHISILGPLEPLIVESEASLLEKLRPGLDGRVLCDGSIRSTFLPAVWKSLDSPRTFVRELKLKAGLPEDHWSPTIRFQRYSAEEIP